MSHATVQQLSHFQLIALKNLYDQNLWPNKIGLIHENGDLIVEFKQTYFGINGLYVKNEVVGIPHTEPPASGIRTWEFDPNNK